MVNSAVQTVLLVHNVKKECHTCSKVGDRCFNCIILEQISIKLPVTYFIKLVVCVMRIIELLHGELLLQHVNKKDPEMLKRGGLSGGSTSADSKKIYPIAISNTASDSAMCVSVVGIFYFCCCYYVHLLCVADC